MIPIPIIIGTIFLGIIAVFIVKLFVLKHYDEEKSEDGEQNSEKSSENAETSSNAHLSKKAGKFDNRRKTQAQFSHAWLASSLKGHSGEIFDMDFSANGKMLVTCSDDRTCLIWQVGEFDEKEHKIIRGNVELDHAIRICFAPDSKSLLCALARDNKIAVYKLTKKDANAPLKFQQVDGVDFPLNLHKMDIINIGISCNGKFVMTASSDTTLVIWDLKGNVLKSIDTKQGNNNYAAVSPCGRFIACAGFTPDVKVWEVLFGKTGDFQDVSRAFELKGHSSGVYSFSFNQDSSRMATASKDGTFRVWNTDIRYQLGQEAIVLLKIDFEELKTNMGRICLAPNADTVVVTANRQLRAYDAETGAEIGRAFDVHGFTAPIVVVKFTADNKYFLTAGDRQVRVFRNVAGYHVTARKAKDQLKSATSAAHKERLMQQAEEAEAMVEKFMQI